MEKLIEAIKAKLGDSFTQELQEEFQANFEILINEKVQVIVAEKEKEIEEKSIEEISDFKDSLIESLDKYIEYATEEYLKENEVALEAASTVKAAKEIIEAAKTVFNVVGLEIPEGEVDRVKELEAELEESNGKLNTSIEKELDSKAQMFEFEKAINFQKSTSSLNEAQVETVHDLLEGLEYKDIEDFDRKVKIVMEKVAVKKTEKKETEINENLDDLDEDLKPSSIDRYLVK